MKKNYSRDCDLFFIPGASIPSNAFYNMHMIRFNYIQLPVSFYNIALTGTLNALPFNINGFFDVPNLINELINVLTVLLPTLIITFDFSTFRFTFSDVAPITLIIDQKTADILGFSNLINGPALVLPTQNIINISPIRKIYFQINGFKISPHLIVIRESGAMKHYNFGFDVSGIEFLTSLNSSLKLKEKIYTDDFEPFEIENPDNVNIKVYDNYDQEIDLSGQSVMLNVTFY